MSGEIEANKAEDSFGLGPWRWFVRMVIGDLMKIKVVEAAQVERRREKDVRGRRREGRTKGGALQGDTENQGRRKRKKLILLGWEKQNDARRHITCHFIDAMRMR